MLKDQNQRPENEKLPSSYMVSARLKKEFSYIYFNDEN